MVYNKQNWETYNYYYLLIKQINLKPVIKINILLYFKSFKALNVQ